MLNRNGNLTNIIGCDTSFNEAEIVVFGAPFDSTTSYRPGTRFASRILRSESFGYETFSPYQDADLLDMHVYDSGDIELPFGDVLNALNMIEEVATEIVVNNKIPFMIGGEHLVTLPVVKAVTKKFPNLKIIHFDAHADLRDEYLGQKLSHATVMRRCSEVTERKSIYQFGIRSGDRDEFAFATSGNVSMVRFDFEGLDEVIENLKDYPVYLTVDLDVLDPSCFPGTGTPEAGGVSFEQLRKSVSSVCKNLNIVAADINELSPHYDASGISTAASYKLFREMCIAILK